MQIIFKKINKNTLHHVLYLLGCSCEKQMEVTMTHEILLDIDEEDYLPVPRVWVCV